MSDNKVSNSKVEDNHSKSDEFIDINIILIQAKS